MSPRARPRPHFRVARLTNWEHRRQREQPRGGRGRAHGAALRSRAWGAAPRGTVRVTTSIGRGALGRDPCLCALHFRALVSGF